MTTLYELSDKILTALDIFSEMDECSEAEKAEAQAIINQLAETFNDKAVSVAMFIRNLEVEAEAIAEAKKSMDAREKALKAKAVRLKSYLLGEMKRTETKQIKCPYFVLSVRKILYLLLLHKMPSLIATCCYHQNHKSLTKRLSRRR